MRCESRPFRTVTSTAPRRPGNASHSAAQRRAMSATWSGATAVGGAVVGNVIDGGRNRVAGTLIGGALGALVGKSIDQSNSDVRCR